MGFIYIWYDRKHKRYYIGSHWGSEDDGYICSSLWMRRAYERRPNDFKRRVLTRITTSRNDLLVEEHRWLSMIKPTEVKVRYYNLKLVAHQVWHTDVETRKTVAKKISVSSQGKKLSSETKEKLKILAANRTPETKSKISEALKGRKRSAETKAKISASHTGKSRRGSGWKHSEETRKKMRRPHKKRET